MRKITDLFFLIEGALIGGFSLNGYLSYNCGGDVLCICIISIIFFILAIVNFIIIIIELELLYLISTFHIVFYLVFILRLLLLYSLVTK